MGIAALDDTFGIINFSIAVAISSILAAHENFNIHSSVVIPLYQIFGAIGFGIIVGFIFNWLTIKLQRENEGTLIVAILAMLALTFGISSLLSIDELLSIMTVGAIVVNFNPKKESIFHMLERYTDELIFVFFFTLSGMHLDFSLFLKYLPLALYFVLFRAIGKISGAIIGSTIAKSDNKIKKFAWGGLIPQGGIVIGLALLIKQNPAFTDFSNILISITIGATVIHELVGPVISKKMIQAAGEIKSTA
ncbi:MAG: cation:proton antiporter [Sedimentisphaerales bacterium]|nr:cation:proton antiporter [Sedimentisphaerales bacterium]